MSLRINQNVLSVATYQSVAQTSSRLEKSIQKLSSGMRINSAADDAAGLAISEKMRRQIRGLNRAVLNAQDGISMIQTAEGALNESHSILQRMRELAIQASNDTLTSNDRLEIQKEVVQLKDDLDRISRNTEFNTKKLLDGSQTALISASSGSVQGLVTGPLDGSAGDYNIQIELLRGGISEMQTSQLLTVKGESGELANGGTQLQSIAQFYDSNGVFVLDTPQSLSINGNGRTVQVTLDGQMTLDNLSAEFQNALVSKTGLQIENSRVATVNTVQTRVAGLGGYLELTSGYIGENGTISFSGDQKVIDALGLSVSRQAENNRISMTTRDGFGNVKTVKTESDTVTGLLNGMDVKFASQAAQMAGKSGLEAGLIFTAVGGEDFTLTIGTSEVDVTIVSGYWTMDGLARSLNSQIEAALAGGEEELLGLSAAVVEGEIRLSYEKPATAAQTLATTVSITNASNSTLGFVNGNYSGFVDGKKDSSKVEWGFSMFVDTAKYTTLAAGDAVIVTVQDGIESAQITIISVVLGAGDEQTSDMKSFRLFQASANDILDTASVAVRIDQHGGAMAFTSLRVGTQHNDATPAFTSMVSLVMTATITSFMQNQFGVKGGTVKGFGDANFRIHVVDNTPQVQIGAEQGQNMAISMANVSAEALGVANVDVTTVGGAQKALAKINKGIDIVSSERSKLGSFQNRLEFAINNLRNTHSNLSAAESRIRDADIAMEMIEFTRNQIVSQSGTAMLAQANMVPQGVLQLLG